MPRVTFHTQKKALSMTENGPRRLLETGLSISGCGISQGLSVSLVNTRISLETHMSSLAPLMALGLLK